MPFRFEDAARFLKLLANRARLLVLTTLATRGEMHVAALNETVGLAPSALSQHLARLLAEGAICRRREHSTLFYRLDPRREAEIRPILAILTAHLDRVEAR